MQPRSWFGEDAGSRVPQVEQLIRMSKPRHTAAAAVASARFLPRAMSGVVCVLGYAVDGRVGLVAKPLNLEISRALSGRSQASSSRA